MTTEYRADRVVVLRDARGKAVLSVIVEIQRAIDAEKISRMGFPPLERERTPSGMTSPSSSPSA